MLFAATRAPSGSNRQPFRFLVLRDGPAAIEAKALLGTSFRAMWPRNAGRRLRRGFGGRPVVGQGPHGRGHAAVRGRVRADPRRRAGLPGAVPRGHRARRRVGLPGVSEPAACRSRPRLRRRDDHVARHGRARAARRARTSPTTCWWPPPSRSGGRSAATAPSAGDRCPSSSTRTAGAPAHRGRSIRPAPVSPAPGLPARSADHSEGVG